MNNAVLILCSFLLIATTVNAESFSKNTVQVQLLFPSNNAVIDKNELRILFDFKRPEHLSMEEYTVCMDYDRSEDKPVDPQACARVPDVWPTEGASNVLVLTDLITGRRSVDLFLYDERSVLVSKDRANFVIVRPGENAEDTLDVFGMTSLAGGNDGDSVVLTENVLAAGDISADLDDKDYKRRLLFNSIFENQLWGKNPKRDQRQQQSQTAGSAFGKCGSIGNARALGLFNEVQLRYTGEDEAGAGGIQLTPMQFDRHFAFEGPGSATGDREQGDGVFEPLDYSISGPGSTLAASHLIREALQGVLQQHKTIRRMVDVPSGDLHWMTHALTPSAIEGSKLVEYVGADISTSLLQHNRQRVEVLRQLIGEKHATLRGLVRASDDTEVSRAARKNVMQALLQETSTLFCNNEAAIRHLSSFVQTLQSVRFEFVDIVGMSGGALYDTIGDVDLLFNRHMMFHLSVQDNVRALRNVEEYGRLVLKKRQEGCTAALRSAATMGRVGGSVDTSVSCDRSPFYFMASTAIFKGSNVKDYVLLLGNVELNLVMAPYCLKHPVAYYRDGVHERHNKGHQPEPLRSAIPEASDNRPGTPEDMYMGLWTMHAPEDSIFADETDPNCRDLLRKRR